MKISEMKDSLRADSLGRNKSGLFVARWMFFYKHGRTVEEYVERVNALIPGVIVKSSGERYAAFRGGASAAQSSHFFVEFAVPSKELAEDGGVLTALSKLGIQPEGQP